MSSDVAIEVAGLSKCYLVYEKPIHRLLQMLWRGRRKYYREFWAVRGVSFKIMRGQTIGIIGKNGAGKSTLLQMICGTVDQTEGDIIVNGKVAALLELGAGFNPEFTGRENVYLSGALYGLTAEQIDTRFEAICAFADIGEFVDRPVKVYSSGMFVRLAFAVIAHVDAEILVVDEALSVGDAYFQQKCMRYLRTFQEHGGTLLFVSHDMGAVTALCESALLLRRIGDQYLCDAGTAKEIAALYLRDMQSEKASEFNDNQIVTSGSGLSEVVSDNGMEKAVFQSGGSLTTYYVSDCRPNPESFGAGGGNIIEVKFMNENKDAITEFVSGSRINLFIRVLALRVIRHPAIGFMLKDRHGQYVMAESTDSYFRSEEITVGADAELVATFSLEMPALVRGSYTLDVAFAEGPGEQNIQQHWIHDILEVTAINEKLVHGIGGAPGLKVRLAVVDGDVKEAEIS